MIVPLSRIPAFDEESGEVTVVIETPRGSRNKYGFDESCGAFRLKGVLPEGTSFPYDFGFVPSTRGEDGDPLDVLVMLDAPAFPGCVLTVRLLGVIEAEQTESTGEVVRNDRILAVAASAPTHEHVHSLQDLRPGALDEIEAFFQHYNRLRGGEFKPLSRGGAEAARALIEHSRFLQT